jgi:glycosyltransferase involved in cell wall biosynthesis
VKIALVSDWFLPRLGGIELHLHDLARRLGAAGHDAVVITPTPGASDVDGVRVRRVSARRAPRFGFLCTPAGVRALGDSLRDEAPDVAHCHVSIVSPAALGGAARAQQLGLPTVVSFHSVVPLTQPLARAAGLALGTSRWRARFTAVSERVARDVHTFAPSSPTNVLPNGIDAACWRTTPAPRTDDILELVSVLRLNSKKRPLALISIMRDVTAALPRDRRVRLRVVGDGPLAPRFERAIRRAGLTDVIEPLGRRSRAEIQALFAGCDVFVLPTLRESFGLAALEARCAGLPVVAMAASGVAEVVRDGFEGLLAHSDREIAARIVTLALDPSRREAIALHNRTTSTRFDWPNVVDAHVAVYREAMALRERV